MFVDVESILKGKPQKMRLTTFNIPQNDWEWLHRHCAKSELTKSHVIRELIKQYKAQVDSYQQ